MNNKGFTLVELIVSIAILGLISAMSVPTLNAVQSQMEEKQFVSYGDALVSAAKLYTDSNYEDMFASGNTAQITYKDMNDKGLVKDIGVDNVSCNTNGTYIVVVKRGSSYVYCLNMECKNSAGTATAYSNSNSEFGSSTGVCQGVKSYNVKYRCDKYGEVKQTVPVLGGQDYTVNFSLCSKTGNKLSSYSYDSSTVYSTNPVIKVTKDIILTANFEAENYTLSYESNCGACTPSSQNANYGSKWGTLCKPSKTGYTFNYWVKKGTTSKITENTVVGNENITVTGNCSPNDYTLTYNTAHGSCKKTTQTAKYDSTWGELCNPTATGYKFGGWFITGTNTEVTKNTKVTGNISVTAKWTEPGPPVVKVNVYKRDSNGNKTGNVISTFNSNGNNSLTINSADVKTNYNGWYNKTNYPYGVYYEFITTDDSGIASVQEKWNNSNQTSYTNPVNVGNVVKNPSSTTSMYLSAEGKRYATYTVTSNNNKTTTVYIYANIDRTAPSVNTFDKWQNNAIIKLNDPLSGAKYLVSTNSNLTASSSGFKSIANNTQKYSGDLAVNTSNGTNYYLYVIDNAGNFNKYSNTINITKNKYLLTSGQSKTTNKYGYETYNSHCVSECYISKRSSYVYFSMQANKSMAFNSENITKNYRYAYIHVKYRRNTRHGCLSTLSIHFNSKINFSTNTGIPESSSGDKSWWFYAQVANCYTDANVNHNEYVLVDLWNKTTNYYVTIHNCDTDAYWYDVYLTNSRPSRVDKSSGV